MMSTTHLHITTWVIGIILFFITYALLKKGNPKAKMLHMITRLFYILIFLSGGMLISNFSYYAQKMIVGILVIAFMELVLVRTKKKKVPELYGLYLFYLCYMYCIWDYLYQWDYILLCNKKSGRVCASMQISSAFLYLRLTFSMMILFPILMVNSKRSFLFSPYEK